MADDCFIWLKHQKKYVKIEFPSLEIRGPTLDNRSKVQHAFKFSKATLF